MCVIAIASAAPKLIGEIPQRKALLIGNDSYVYGRPLHNATNDARDMATKLTSLGYSIALAVNVTQQQLSQAMEVFGRSLVAGDTAVVYYSGHGFQVDGENYLVPVDFKAISASAGKEQAYSVSAVLQRMTSGGAAIQIVILDACRDNPFFSSRSSQAGWANEGVPAGTLVAYGTAPGSTASDNPTQTNGLFTKALLSHISSTLPIEDMLKQVRQDTIVDSSGLQIPWISSNLTGVFSLNPESVSRTQGANQLSLQEQVTSALSSVRSLGTKDREWQQAGELSSADSNSADILLHQGLLLVQQGNYGEAMRSLSMALAFRPGLSIALRTLGLIFNVLGRGADAIAQFTRAIEVDPGDHLAYYYRCSALTKEDPSDAIRDCEAAIGLSPKFIPAHVGLANALLAAGKTEYALREINTSLALAPESSRAHALRAEVFKELGQYEDAAKDVKAAVRLSVAATGP
jgi:Tfp pilus assembly protein PilF